MSRYGRMRASFDSDVASLTNSPPASPPRHGHPVLYFVQSPSRDSMHDGDSLSHSFSRATPRDLSPMPSPLHPKHSKHPSTDSLPFASSHTPKPGSRRVLPHQPNYAAESGSAKKAAPPWGSIPEEGIEADQKRPRLSRVCLVWIAIFFTIVMFFAGAFLFWLVTMPKSPHVSVHNVAFQYFGLDDGVDNSGVPTMVVSLNATATLHLYNPSRFFGYHVKSSPVSMKYLDLSMAQGQLSSFLLEKRTTKKVNVAISADKQFLHGAGPSFDQSYSAPTGGVAMKLEGSVFTRAYVMGHMLKNKFRNSVACTFTFEGAGGGGTQWKVQQLACIYASS